jgi:hypothetical protein
MRRINILPLSDDVKMTEIPRDGAYINRLVSQLDELKGRLFAEAAVTDSERLHLLRRLILSVRGYLHRHLLRKNRMRQRFYWNRVL